MIRIAEQSQDKEFAIYNLDRHCFLGELGGYTERQTFSTRREVVEFLLDQVHNHGHLRESDLKHLEVVSIRPENRLTDKARKAAKQYRDQLDEETPNEEVAEQVLKTLFDGETEVTE